MEIIELQETDRRWGQFLKAHKHLVFHTPGYKQFIEHAFSCTTHYLAAVEDGKIKALFPFYEIRHLLLGKKVISTAYTEYGGPCGEAKYVAPVLEHAKKKFSDADFIEVRQGLEELDEVLDKHTVKRVDYKRFLLRLYDDEKTLSNIDKAKRKAIKKAEKEGVAARELAKEDIGELYSLYLKNMKSFGSPPYNERYFECFFEHIADKGLGKAFGAFINNKLASALLGFTYQDRIHAIIAVSDPKFLELRVNDAVHWAFMRWGCNNGFTVFDFGRVREDSGQFTYKKRWGAEMHDLNHYYLLVKGKEIPKVDPGEHKLAVKIWSKLPLFVTKMFGHWLREGLGI